MANTKRNIPKGARPSLFASSVLPLLIGFVVLLGIVVMTYLLAERSRTYFDKSMATRDQRTATVQLRNALLAAESSQRGFIYSGNEVYLAPFDTARSQSLRWLDALERTVGEEEDARPLVDRLRSLSTMLLSDMETMIELKRDRKDDEVVAMFRTNRGKALMDEANVFFSGLILAADDQLTAGIVEQRSNATWLRVVTVLGGLIIVVVVGYSTASVMRQTRDLAAAHAELAALNTGLEAKVAARTADLAQANEEIQRFAYIVTHDLRAPLVNIMGFTNELETNAKTLFSVIEHAAKTGALAEEMISNARFTAEQELPEAIHFIRSSTRKMDDLIKAILLLAREGRRLLRPETTDLKQAIAAAAASVQHQIQSGGGVINLDIDVTPVTIDKVALDQIVGNLLDNAVKYRSTSRPLVITIRARGAEANRFTLEIRDNGRGIAARDLDRIFDPFRRAGLQDQPGEGIGLAMVKALVIRLGGTIAVESVLDSGTIFTIALPKAPAS